MYLYLIHLKKEVQMATIQRFSTCLWFDGQAEEAAKYYTGIFKNSRIIRTAHYGKEGQEIHKQKPGSVLTVEFELDGQRFLALNGGPEFKFNEAVSIMINCETQQEIDYYWGKLSNGDPKSEQCGWLKDKFSLSWQVYPIAMAEMIADPDVKKADRVMKVMMKMKKLDIEKLEEAYHGKVPA
jgi:predicted 3-demethylubiquinone-9 3-methyltransferase (glyoxalase superfamily)